MEDWYFHCTSIQWLLEDESVVSPAPQTHLSLLFSWPFEAMYSCKQYLEHDEQMSSSTVEGCFSMNSIPAEAWLLPWFLFLINMKLLGLEFLFVPRVFSLKATLTQLNLFPLLFPWVDLNLNFNETLCLDLHAYLPSLTSTSRTLEHCCHCLSCYVSMVWAMASHSWTLMVPFPLQVWPPYHLPMVVVQLTTCWLQEIIHLHSPLLHLRVQYPLTSDV